MATMTLREAIVKIAYDNNWGIWAEVPFTPDSEARIGQRVFENGGPVDEKVFFADGEVCGNFISNYLDGASIEDWGDEAACEMIAEYEATREQFEATDEA